jgi:hypothetical protein
MRQHKKVPGVHSSIILCHTVCVLCMLRRLAASRVGVDQLQPCYQSANIIHTQNISTAVHTVSPDDELETCTGY